jgi:hypothetical protein
LIRLVLHVLPVQDSDAEDLADLADQLRAELLDLDVVAVFPVTAGEVPEGAKGIGSVAGWLAAQFGTPDGLRAVMAAVRGFASRTGRPIEVSIDGNVLKVGSATAQQQEEIIDAWLSRYGSRS